jgi:hypothetical protein
MGIIEQQQAIADAINEREAVDAPTALAGLQNIYRDKRLSLHVRMREMREALPFETPKLCAVAVVNGDDFGARLDRAIKLSREGPQKLIELHAQERRDE